MQTAKFRWLLILLLLSTGISAQSQVKVTGVVTDAFGEESDSVLEYAYLNSYYQTGLKNLLDVAVLDHVEVVGVEEIHILSRGGEVRVRIEDHRCSLVLQRFKASRSRLAISITLVSLQGGLIIVVEVM